MGGHPGSLCVHIPGCLQEALACEGRSAGRLPLWAAMLLVSLHGVSSALRILLYLCAAPASCQCKHTADIEHLCQTTELIVHDSRRAAHEGLHACMCMHGCVRIARHASRRRFHPLTVKQDSANSVTTE